MIIIFRGTIGRSQLIQEGIVGMKPNIDFYGYGRVNEYFHKALLSHWHYVEDILLDKKYFHCNVTFTGHSLGGALASLAAMRTVMFELRSSDQVQLYTYGQPRTGNYEFAMLHDRLVPRSFRVINGNDMVPHVPFCRFSDSTAPKDANNIQDENTLPISDDQLSDKDNTDDSGDTGDFSLVDMVKARPCKGGQTRKAYHHGTEIWYPDGMSGSSICFIVCQGSPKNEDHSCSNGAHPNNAILGCTFQSTEQNKCQPLPASDRPDTNICKDLLKKPPKVWMPPNSINFDDQQEQQQGDKEECKNLSPICSKSFSACKLEAYRLLMLVKCPMKCGMCEDHKHLPSSKNACKNNSLSCFTKLRSSKCKTDAKVRADCPYTCGDCK
ncbi:Lipase [Aphelenchoides bicaudatus]|nr:Lipase [Aphelenchoides bicaudatus]